MLQDAEGTVAVCKARGRRALKKGLLGSDVQWIQAHLSEGIRHLKHTGQHSLQRDTGRKEQKVGKDLRGSFTRPFPSGKTRTE